MRKIKRYCGELRMAFHGPAQVTFVDQHETVLESFDYAIICNDMIISVVKRKVNIFNYKYLFHLRVQTELYRQKEEYVRANKTEV